MATTTPAAVYEHVVDEEELMALRELAETDVEETDRTDRAMAADLMTLLRMVADLDDAGRALCPEELAWAQDLEDDMTQSAANLAAMAENILRGAAVLETRLGEDQVAELRRRAAQSCARAADARKVVAAARRLREKETRRMAAMEHVADPSVMGFLARVARQMDLYASVGGGGVGPATEEVAAAAGAAERVEEEMAKLRLWLVMAALDCEERPGEAALVAPLRRQADKAKAAIAAVDAFRASMRRYQVAAGIAPPPEEETGSEDDDTMTT